VPPIPVDLAPAERRAVIATAAEFVRTAVRREDAERGYDVAGPTLRAGTTRAEWRAGDDIPVVPYPVGEARWTFDYAYEGEIGLRVALFPPAGSSVRPAVFDMALRRGAGRWLVDAWSPHGGGVATAAARSEGAPLGPPPESPAARLGAEWLLVPAGLVGLGLLVPLALLAAGALRARRAARP
jgi:hypothetical protein